MCLLFCQITYDKLISQVSSKLLINLDNDFSWIIDPICGTPLWLPFKAKLLTPINIIKDVITAANNFSLLIILNLWNLNIFLFLNLILNSLFVQALLVLGNGVEEDRSCQLYCTEQHQRRCSNKWKGEGRGRGQTTEQVMYASHIDPFYSDKNFSTRVFN